MEETTNIFGPSLFDILGTYPALLALLAIGLGIVALILRKRIVNLAIAHALVAVGVFGFGTTAWRIHETNSLLLPSGSVDPTSWMISLGYSWMASSVVLPAVGIGFLLLAVSWLFTRPITQRIEEQNKPAHATAGNAPV